MNRFVTTLFLLCSYCAPAFLGDAGLHELFCVAHHESHQHACNNHACEDAHCHHERPFHDHSAENSARQDKHKHKHKHKHEPDGHQHSEEENCILCQHIAKSQLKVVSLELEAIALLVTQTAIISDLSPGIACVSLHVPRGPPALL